MNILAISDVELGFIYSPQIAQRFKHIDVVICCGDLPYYYIEFVISVMDKPLYHVLGNHANRVESGAGGEREEPWGAVNLHRRTVRDPGTGLLMAGIEGCMRYNYGPQQYSQEEMWFSAFGLAANLMLNRLRYGRYLDVLVTHAPPWKINDMDDLPHQGIKAFRWLLKVFKPALHLHGHIHVYRSHTPVETQFEQTRVLNAYGYREINFEPGGRRATAINGAGRNV